MKIVIDIPEGIMEYVKNNGCLSVYDEEVTEAIINGTPYEDRPQGEWLWLGFDDGDSRKWSCSLCGRGVKNQENFCPNCGADMRGDKE